MASTITSFYIDNSSLRYMVSRGKRVADWAYVPLEEGLVVNNVITDENEMALKIKKVMADHNNHSRSVFVGLSGLHCISRSLVLPVLPKEMLDEAVKREARRVFPVPPEEVYMSWQEIPGSTGRCQIFAVAIPITTVDSVIAAFSMAGLRVSSLGIKSLFLAKAAHNKNAIIVDVQTTEFDIVVVADGIPQTIRTLLFSEEARSPSEKINAVFNELERTISFYNAANAVNKLDEDAPIYLSGELWEELDLSDNFSSYSERPVITLKFPLEHSAAFENNRYSPNLGIAADQIDGKDDSSFMIQNSLPTRYRPQPVSLGNVITIPAGSMVVLLVAFLVMNNLTGAGRLDALQKRTDEALAVLEERTAQSQEISADIAELKSSIAETESARNNYTLLAQDMENTSLHINGDLTEIITSLPVAISLRGINHSGDTLEIQGNAGDEKDILLYITQLGKSNKFGEMVITDLEKLGDETQDFTLMIDISQPPGESSLIDTILRYFPDEVVLLNLSQSGDTTTMEANAPDEDSIILFLQQLEESGLFQEIALDSQVSAETGGINFVFTVVGGDS